MIRLCCERYSVGRQPCLYSNQWTTDAKMTSITTYIPLVVAAINATFAVIASRVGLQCVYAIYAELWPWLAAAPRRYEQSTTLNERNADQ